MATKTPRKGKAGPSNAPPSVETYIMEPIKRNFAPEGEEKEKDKDNIIHWEAPVGGGNSLRLQTWLKTGGSFINLRKAPNVGATVGTQYRENLIMALDAMKEDCPQFFDRN